LRQIDQNAVLACALLPNPYPHEHLRSALQNHPQGGEDGYLSSKRLKPQALIGAVGHFGDAGGGGFDAFQSGPFDRARVAVAQGACGIFQRGW
jgi:hypothetical protein